MVERRWLRLWPLPSWLLSAIVHAALLVTLGLTIQAESHGLGDEPGRKVGISLAHVDSNNDRWFESHDESTETQTSDAQPSQVTPSDHPLAEVIAEGPPVDLQSALPKQRDLVGIGAVDPGGNPSASGLTQGAAPKANLKAGFARTQVYGITGQGHKFVYVFDRSLSMGGTGNNALGAAKAQLLASVDQLGPGHQFQIVFYNEKPTIFPISGQQYRLVFATDANKRSAHSFVGGIVADGGTNHLAALEVALRLDPDVIFFLTDADQPGLSPGQMLRIRQRNDHATIHCIEFGQGAKTSGANFLQLLAHESGGQYVYFDLARGLPQ